MIIRYQQLLVIIVCLLSPLSVQSAAADGAGLFEKISRRGSSGNRGSSEHFDQDLDIEQEIESSYEGVFQIQFANDVFFDSDQHFTSGFSLFWQPRLVDRWEDTYLPSILAKWVGRIPALNAPGAKRRLGFALVHITVTPEDLLESEVIQDDLPYTGFLGTLFQFSSSNNDQLNTIQLTLGLVGESSLAEPIQKEVHRVTQTDVPNGWPNQLKDEF
ncbi:MAG: DUF2219 family protein, partial [Planctomycetota bacterium]|nr:DUF2219 family protein [Planctomycetota bacterium]